MKILFVCRHNRFRSKVAEAIFNFYAKNKHNSKQKYSVRSRGIIKDIDIAENLANIMEKKKGIKILNKKSMLISEKDIKWADLIIIVANNVDLKIKNQGKKIMLWKISDTSQEDNKGILERINLIEKKIKNLINLLE